MVLSCLVLLLCFCVTSSLTRLQKQRDFIFLLVIDPCILQEFYTGCRSRQSCGKRKKDTFAIDERRDTIYLFIDRSGPLDDRDSAHLVVW